MITAKLTLTQPPMTRFAAVEVVFVGNVDETRAIR
jgi:hypothetical protein